MSRSKAIGTAAETAVVRVARRFGFPDADRLALSGVKDRGDVRLTTNLDVVVEVKGGNQARTATDRLVDAWLVETETGRRNAGAKFAFLVVQRAGVGAPNAHKWHAYWRIGWLGDLLGFPTADPGVVVRLSVGDSLALLHRAGFR